MVFRTTDHRMAKYPAAINQEAVLAEAHRSFDAPVEPRSDGTVVIGELWYLYDASTEPHFVLVPECDTCGTHDLEQFPLEIWNLDGVAVRGQARASCRDCRFVALANR
jgi:hypothetical protein